MPSIILASSSPFRQAILKNLRLEFDVFCPDIDERRRDNESPQALVERLAIEKARKSQARDDQYVIGSDQVATIDGEILGKPHTVDNAVAQLTKFSGRAVDFYTGLCVRRGRTCKSLVEPFRVHFRELTSEEIHLYVKLEQPLNCAGAFKSEGLGIHLFSQLEGRDPNALIGLPVIGLGELFRQFGVNLLSQANLK